MRSFFKDNNRIYLKTESSTLRRCVNLMYVARLLLNLLFVMLKIIDKAGEAVHLIRYHRHRFIIDPDESTFYFNRGGNCFQQNIDGHILNHQKEFVVLVL